MLDNAAEKGNRHAVDVAGAGGGGGVDICVGVDPDEAELLAGAFVDGLCGAEDGAHGDGVVTAEGEGEAAVGGVVVDLVGEGVGDGGDGEGGEHVVDAWVVGGDEGGVGVHCLVPVEVVG